MMVPRTGREGGNTAYFKDEAQSAIRAFIMHIVTAEPAARRNLVTLREYVCADAHAWERLLAAMKANKAANGLIAREAAQLERREVQSAGEFSAVLSTIKQDTNFIEDPVMQRALAGSGADLEALKGFAAGRRIRGCVVSVVMPLQYLDTHAAYSRLIIGVALWTMQRGRLSRGRVLFLLDEFPALKRMDRIASGLATLRKYRVWLWPIIQNIGQLRNLYGENWQTFVSNAGFKQFIGAGDLETAQYVSDLCGEATIVIRTRGPGGTTRSETRRLLATPTEIMTMRSDLQIVFADNLKPMFLHKRNYWERPELEGTFHRNPYHPGTPRLPGWAGPARLFGLGVRFAAWLVRPAAPLVAAVVMAAAFCADPGVLISEEYERRAYALNRLVCEYATFTGPRRFYVVGPTFDRHCWPVFFRGMTRA
jgi:type IV secretion system protein VirD4